MSFSSSSVVFWLGDLNYRVSDLDSDVVRRLADAAQYEELLANDQLNRQRNEKKCFKGFQEGNINFKPTYKYDPGTDNWDTRYVSLYNNETNFFNIAATNRVEYRQNIKGWFFLMYNFSKYNYILLSSKISFFN